MKNLLPDNFNKLPIKRILIPKNATNVLTSYHNSVKKPQKGVQRKERKNMKIEDMPKVQRKKNKKNPKVVRTQPRLDSSTSSSDEDLDNNNNQIQNPGFVDDKLKNKEKNSMLIKSFVL